MRRAGEVCARFNPEKSEHVVRKHDAAHHQENRAQKNSAIHDRLQNAEYVVTALEQRKEEAPVQRDMHRPQNKQHHAQNLVNGGRFKEIIAAHQHERRDRHRDIKRHTDFCGNRHIREYTLFRLHVVFVAHGLKPFVARSFAGNFDCQMLEPGIRSRSVPMLDASPILRADFLFLNRFQPPFEHECAKVRNGVEFSVEADVLVRQFNAELYVAVIFLCNQVV